MVDVKLPASGNIRLWYLPLNGLANWRSPSNTEINAGIDISDAISWNDFDFGIQASSTTDDPAITAKGRTTARGASQYGGTISLYLPEVLGDTSNKYAIVYEALRLPWTEGYIIMRVDGEELTTTASTASNPGTIANPNDLVHVFKVMTDGYAVAITGEESFRETITFKSRGALEPYTVVRSGATAPAVAVTPLTMALTSTAPYGVVNATVNTRRQTRAVRWTTSNAAVATVSRNGVVTRVSNGTANIIATYPETGTAATAPLVVTTTT